MIGWAILVAGEVYSLKVCAARMHAICVLLEPWDGRHGMELGAHLVQCRGAGWVDDVNRAMSM